MQLYDESFCISTQFSQKCISMGPIDITPELVRVIMQWLDAKQVAESHYKHWWPIYLTHI